jgi:tetratricopeptide (TPR) repeat protein
MICMDEGNFDEANRLKQGAAKILEEIGDVSILCITYNNLGDLNYRIGDFKSSMIYYQKLAELAGDIGDNRFLSTACAGIAELLLASEEVDRALEYAQQAEEAVHGIETGVEAAVSYRVLGDTYLALGEARKAKEYLDKAIPLLEDAWEYAELEKASKSRDRSAQILGDPQTKNFLSGGKDEKMFFETNGFARCCDAAGLQSLSVRGWSG